MNIENIISKKTDTSRLNKSLTLLNTVALTAPNTEKQHVSKKHILLRINNTGNYLIDVPKSFEDLKTIICQKTKIQLINVNKMVIMSGRNQLNIENYDTIINNSSVNHTDGMIILTITFQLKGGFPNFSMIITELVIVAILLPIIFGIIILFFIPFVVFNLEQQSSDNKSISTIINKFSMNNIELNLLVISLCVFIYVFVLSLTTVIAKNEKCNIDISYKKYCIWSFAPFFIILFLLFLKLNISYISGYSNEYYVLFSCIFLLFTMLIINHSNNILNSYETIDKPGLSDFNKTILVWALCFFVLRFILYFNSSEITGLKFIAYYVLILLFAYIASTTNMTSLFIEQVAGDYTICQKS